MVKTMLYLALLAALLLGGCGGARNSSRGGGAGEKAGAQGYVLVLPASLEARRGEFVTCVDSAMGNIEVFAAQNGWGELTKEPFMDSVMIFDDKALFNQKLLAIDNADPATKLPDTYCATLEKRVLVAVTPEYYAGVYPQGVEEHSYVKLLTHEIAHQLHVRILRGIEDAMGPMWFYEGFAIYAANQFPRSVLTLSKEEMIDVMKNPERGSYEKYAFVFRYFARKAPLGELITRAKDKEFDDEMARMID